MSAAIYAIIKCDTVDILGTWLGPKRRGPAWRALRHRVHPPSMSSRLSCVWSTNKRNERNGRRLRVAAREVKAVSHPATCIRGTTLISKPRRCFVFTASSARSQAPDAVLTDELR